MTGVVEADGLAIGYRDLTVGTDLTLAIEAGSVTALLGPNGCGKSTLFKTLLGLLPAKAGRVRLSGDELSVLGRREIARRLAYVPQVVEGYFPFTVLDVALMGRAAALGLFAQPGAADRDAAMTALETVGIARLATRPFTAISGGQRQLCLIARALAQAAPVLVMDEPTSNLDFGNQARVLAQVAALRAAGRTVVISTHHPDHAFRIADRVVLMKDGAILAHDAPSRALTPERLESVYGLPVVVAEIDTPAGPRWCCLPGKG